MFSKRRRLDALDATRPYTDGLHIAVARGCVAYDVADTVDWQALARDIDALVGFQKHPLTYDVVSHRCKIRTHGGTMLPLLEALAGKKTSEEMPKASDSTVDEAVFVLSKRMALKDVRGKGRGWVASMPLPAGTTLLVEKPLFAVLDSEWSGECWAGASDADAAALSVRLAQRLSPDLGRALTMLHPPQDASPATPAFGGGPQLQAAVDEAWASVPGITTQQKMRLEALVRLNAIGFYTNSEQICHVEKYAAFNGCGVLGLGSFFNHSCAPQVANFAIGDVVVFVTNRPVDAGEHLCITYIETELLCAPRLMRQQALNRDFTCECAACAVGRLSRCRRSSLQAQRLSPRVQGQIPKLDAAARVAMSVKALRAGCAHKPRLRNSRGLVRKASLVGADAQQLRVVQAQALMELGDYLQALAIWRRLAAFTCYHCPAFDEALSMYGTQAALCALSMSADGLRYIAAAIASHRVTYGVGFYRWRYKSEVEYADVDGNVKSRFWQLVGKMSEDVVTCWGDYLSLWGFASVEIPRIAEKPKACLVAIGARRRLLRRMSHQNTSQ